MVPLCAEAQGPRDILLQSREHQWTIAVIAGTDTTEPGRVRRLTNDSVAVGRSSVAISRIIEIARLGREGGGGEAGALAGAGMLGALGLVAITEFCRPNCSFRELAGGVAVGATVGATLGAFIGGAAKTSKHVWVRLWPKT
jgi:hypothetical protein